MINKKYTFPTYVKGAYHNTIYNERKNSRTITLAMAKPSAIDHRRENV